MIVGIVGLGLIGGSLAKAFKKFTSHTVLGCDKDAETLEKALLAGAIDGTIEEPGALDVLLVALCPQAAIAHVASVAPMLNKRCIVVDMCGVKRVVCRELFPLAERCGFTFIGGHPMAGTEFSGFDHARETLFKNASMILVPDGRTDTAVTAAIGRVFLDIGFAKIRFSTPEEHDKMIALTSQLAHVLSSAYVKAPSAVNHRGFSAGSFRDMTRVAKLSEDMWCELFFANKDNLAEEIDGLISRLGAYREALCNDDRDGMANLLKEGKERRALIDGKYEKDKD